MKPEETKINLEPNNAGNEIPTEPIESKIIEVKSSTSQRVERRRNFTPVEEEVKYKEVPVSELSLEDLNNLSPEGKDYLKTIFNSLTSKREQNGIVQFALEENFHRFTSLLIKEFPKASLSEILQLGEDVLKLKIKSIIPKELPIEPKDLKFTPQIKKQFEDSLLILEYSIKEYARENKIPLEDLNPLNNLSGWLKYRLVGHNPKEAQIHQEGLDLMGQLEFLNNLRQNPVLTKEVLDRQIRYLDKKHPDPDKRTNIGGLFYAIRYSTLYVPELNEYIEQIQNPDRIVGKALIDKTYLALKMVADGYGEKPFSSEDSINQFNSGTAVSAGGSNYGYLDKGYIKTVKVVE